MVSFFNFELIKESLKNVSQFIHKNIKQHNCFNIYIRKNVSWAANQHIKMISVLTA